MKLGIGCIVLAAGRTDLYVIQQPARMNGRKAWRVVSRDPDLPEAFTEFPERLEAVVIPKFRVGDVIHYQGLPAVVHKIERGGTVVLRYERRKELGSGSWIKIQSLDAPVSIADIVIENFQDQLKRGDVVLPSSHWFLSTQHERTLKWKR